MLTLAIHALLYGDYIDLHRRLVDSLVAHALTRPGSRAVLWCNQVGAETRRYLADQPCRCIFSDQNIGKYKAMGRMFAEDVPEEWIVWFDDDSAITAPDWLPKTESYIAAHRSENLCYFGPPWFMPHFPGRWDFVRQSRWFAGRRPMVQNGPPGIEFAQGSYWWLRADIMRLLDWPDSRLNHNGGDTLLAEAIRQQNLPFHHFAYGVRFNDAPRRGYSEAPAGANDPQFRV